ncbi:hypothetical protein ACIQJT_21220 [Streptomyces sp. NPDC091972]|uniref:hypothetical protein n=1 Tax=Streptomyces sp. NPDC091972 TaxID=3366007 RepID=UPI003807BFCA
MIRRLGRRRRAGFLTGVLLAVLLASAFAGGLTLRAAGRTGPVPEFRPEFPERGLVTNEFAYWHPDAPGARHSPDWTMTSGSLFGLGGAGWSGRPDGERPDAGSVRATDSAVFRLASRRRDFGDTRLFLRLRVTDLVTTPRTPAQPYDGVHLWLRFHSEQECYAVSVVRRDGQVVVKRKTPGGPANGGTYVTLATASATLPPDGWTPVVATATDLPDRRVRITLDIAGRRVLDVTDASPGGLYEPGGVGVRGDNTEFMFRDLTAQPE